MRKHFVLRIVSVITSMLLLSGGSLSIFAVDTNVPILKIEQLEITNDTLLAQEEVCVKVTLSDNMDGFLATSFGIKYDPALVLKEVTGENQAAAAHCCNNNPTLGLIWFSGAGGYAEDTANIATTETMFTLCFSMPDDLTAGSEFPISFVWEAPDQSQAFWYNAEHANIIGEIRNNALNGSIRISDPNAPKLSETFLELSTDDSTVLSVLNYDGNITWISDNVNVADVKDGTVTAYRTGSCTIYAMLDGAALSCSILVTEDAKYDVSKTDVIYIRNPNKNVYLRCPPEIDPSSIVWLSNNAEVVSVENGQVIAHRDGAATIFALSGSTIYQMMVIVELQYDEILYGDVNLDGTVDILDVILLNRTILGVYTLDNSQKLTADIYNDGKISGMDSLCILKYVVELLDSIPIKPE